MTYTHSCFIRHGASFGVIFRGAPSLWLAHARTVETNLCFPPMKGYVLIRRMLIILFVATLPVFFNYGQRFSVHCYTSATKTNTAAKAFMSVRSFFSQMIFSAIEVHDLTTHRLKFVVHGIWLVYFTKKC